MRFSLLGCLYIAVEVAAATTAPAGCGYDSCLWKDKIPAEWKPAATAFCKFVLGGKIPTASTRTICGTTLATSIVTPTPVTITQGTQVVVTATANTCTPVSSVTTSTLTPTLYYSSRPAAAPSKRAAEEDLFERDGPATPSFFTSGCSNKAPPIEKLKDACKCFLTPPTVTVTKVRTARTTATAQQQSATVIVTSTVTSTVDCVASTSASTVYVGPDGTAATARTSSTITCPTDVPAGSPPGSGQRRFRIEGNDAEGTIYEDCIVAGPRIITTPSGGSHLCDGTQNNANPAPIVTPTDMIDAAAALNGFGYDGTYSNSFQDYFITSIGSSSQTSSMYWGILDNGQYTPTGGCQYGAYPGSSILWAYNAFNKNVFLNITPDYFVRRVGDDAISVVVTDQQSGNRASGAFIQTASDGSGLTSDGSGVVTIPIPTTPGYYQYKATRSDGLRSNALYLAVLAAE